MKTYNILTFNEKLILSNQTQKEVDTFFIDKEKSLYLLEVESQEPMKTKKQELIDEPKELKSESDVLKCFYSNNLHKYCLRFNGKLFTYKTWNGYVSKRNYLIEQFKLLY